MQMPAPSQIVVVVDGNPEAAVDIRNHHPKCVVVSMPESAGEATARQTGISACNAEWVSFLDDDDLWSPRKQAVTASYLADHPECEAVRAGYWVFASPDSPLTEINGQSIELRAVSLEQLEQSVARTRPLNDLDYLDIQGDSLSKMLEFNRGVIGTTTVKRDLLQSIDPVPADQRPGADHLLFCMIAERTEWHLIRDRLAYYRVHLGQDTRVGTDKARGILRAKLRAWERLGGVTQRELSEYGPLYRREVRDYVWAHARRRRIREARSIYMLARPLLPRRRDRIAVLVPSPVVWHIRRWIRQISQNGAGIPQRVPDW